MEHRDTKTQTPKTNTFCERFHRTLKQEFFSVEYRKTLYESVRQLQDDLDRGLVFYNDQRSHPGVPHPGRTPS